MKRGIWPVAGCDEAGRGPLAGPVVAAAVILDPEAHSARAQRFQEARRAKSARRSTRRSAPPPRSPSRSARPQRIDRDNILRASLWALARAVRALPVRPKLVFVDGRDRIDCRLRLRGGDQRRCAGAVDRGRLDRRQGDARPADDAARRRPSRLRLRAPHGLQRAGAFRGAHAARADHPSPPLVRAGCGALCGDAGGRRWRPNVACRSPG